MKKILLILLLLPAFSFAQVLIKNGTGSGGASIAQFDIRNYGADTSSADNAASIQTAINAAHIAGYKYNSSYYKGNAGGGVVVIPPGVWKTGKIVSYANVTIQGSGYLASQLKAVGTDTLISVRSLLTAPWVQIPFANLANNLIADVTLNGDSACNVGFFMNTIANFYIGRIFVHDFLSKGMILKNSLIGTVEGGYIIQNPIGVLSYSVGDGFSASNHIIFRDMVVSSCSKWAFDLSGGGVIKIDHGDMESNGSTDTLSGSIYYHDNIWPGGLTVDNCWFEANQGTDICIMNNQGTGGFSPNGDSVAVHSILNCQDIGQQYDQLARNIYIQGTNQRLGIVNSYISGSIKTVVADGNVKVNVFGTTLKNTVMRGGATLTTSGN